MVQTGLMTFGAGIPDDAEAVLEELRHDPSVALHFAHERQGVYVRFAPGTETAWEKVYPEKGRSQELATWQVVERILAESDEFDFELVHEVPLPGL